MEPAPPKSHRHLVREAAARAQGSPSPASPWAAPSAWAIIAAFGVAVGWLALAGHRVGDYGAESDFYGGYAQGARLVQQGHWEPARYTVVGPVYETTLALASGLLHDTFLAAKLLSLISALGILILWYGLVARRFGPAAGAWVLAFLAINPIFVRHAYAASTDMLAVLLQAAAVVSMLARPPGRLPALAGTLAGLATLTRYSSLYLVPGAWLGYGWLAPPETGSRRAAIGWFSAGFLAVLIPWCAYSVGSGVVPGEMLLRGYGFYAAEGPSRNVQDTLHDLDQTPAPPQAWNEVALRAPGTFAAKLLRAIPEHLAGDARALWGWPAFAALLAGLALLSGGGRGRTLAPVAGLGGLCFLTLVPAFHSSRYSLPLVLFYATAAGGLALPASWVRMPRVIPRCVRVGGVVALGLMLASAVRLQRQVMAEAPTEVVAAAQALDQRATAAERVISRKGHIGYYSGRDVVPFPRVRTLRELGAYARSAGASFLYYSWYETQLRPEFAYLLDTTSAIPGLTVVHAGAGKPAILFRLGPEFGQPPEWLADPFEQSVHVARGMVLVMGEQAPAAHHAVLALDALLGGRWAESAAHARDATRLDPEDALTWAVGGEALRRLGRDAEAREAYVRGAVLDPSDPAAWIGLGRIEHSAGHPERAASLWRAAAAKTRDPLVLAEISGLLGGVADSSGVLEVRRAIERSRGERAVPMSAGRGPGRSITALPGSCRSCMLGRPGRRGALL